MGQIARGKKRGREGTDTSTSMKQSRMCSDFARRPAGGHRNGNHSFLWITATDFRPVVVPLPVPLLGSEMNCSGHIVHLHPQHCHDSFDVVVFLRVDPQAVMAFSPRGISKSVMGTSGHSITWF